MTYLSNITRAKGDPKVLQAGQSSLGPSDQLSRALGWFSLALGVTELVAPRRITQALGMKGNEGLVRAYSAREIGSGLLRCRSKGGGPVEPGCRGRARHRYGRTRPPAG